MKSKLVIYLIIAASLAAAGAMTGVYFFSKKAPNLEKTKPDYICTIEELVAAFETDEAAATQKYVNKIVQVSGTVSLIEAKAGMPLNITLSESSNYSGVICSFNETVAIVPEKISPGTKLAVKGVCSGYLMDVLMNNCVLVN
jgi:hypothetical protein